MAAAAYSMNAPPGMCGQCEWGEKLDNSLSVNHFSISNNDQQKTWERLPVNSSETLNNFLKLLPILFFPSLFCIGAYFSYLGANEIVEYYYIKNWPSVEGQIQEARLIENKVKMASGWSYFYENELKYTYTVDGVSYESWRYSNNPFRRMDTEKIQAGKPAQVLYSPINHSYSLLYQDFNPDSIFTLILGLLILTVFFLLMKFSVVGKMFNSWNKVKAYWQR